MKSLFLASRRLTFITFLTLSLFSVLVLPAQAQQQKHFTSEPLHWRTHFPIPAHISTAKDLALRRTAQLHANKSLPQTTSYQTSQNWSGYTVGSGSGNGFQGVEGKWSAPKTSGNIDAAHDYASWVGLGGFFPAPPYSFENLEQSGIILQTDGTYRLFWAFVYSGGAGATVHVDPNDVVHYSDHIYAWVHYNYSGCSNGFYAHVEDDSTNPHLHLGSTCIVPSQGVGQQSADWIDERPEVTCDPNIPVALPYLADFNYIGWSDVQAQANYSGAQWQNPNSFANTQRVFESGDQADKGKERNQKKAQEWRKRDE